MDLTNQALIRECILVNHAGGNEKTIKKYEAHLKHFDEYISAVHGVSFYTAQRKHVVQFMTHLEHQGGAKPHESRLQCPWCRLRGYPDGRGGSKGWAASTRKGYLMAIRFLYEHFFWEDELPSINPAAHIPCPKVVVRKGFTPTKAEVEKLLAVQGSPNDTLLVHWEYFAPARRAMFVAALWREMDLDKATWEVVEKGEKVETFALHPVLVRRLRQHLAWQLREAQSNAKVRDALSDPDTAHVLLTRNGKPVHPNTVTKMAKWRARRAGVGVITAKGKWDAPGGKTSKVHPHAFRRGWATHSLDNGTPIEVVRDVLGHADISTTLRHYAFTKPDRARQALLNMPLPTGGSSPGPRTSSNGGHGNRPSPPDRASRSAPATNGHRERKRHDGRGR